MKNYKILNKQVPAILLVAILAFAGIGSAALVGHLSNMVTANIEVSSPMVAGISLGRDSWSTTQCVNKDPNDPNYDKLVDSFPECDFPDIHEWNSNDWTITETPLLIPNIHGGETVTLYTMSKNIANAEITGFEEAIVTNLIGVTCADFESVKVRVDSIYGSLGYGTEHELISDGCDEIDGYNVQFGSPDPSIWGAGETDVTKIVVTFEEAALGTYTFSYRVVPAV